ncbi:MAG: N-acetyltransferase [Pseudomonadales bacterium]
MTQATLTIRDAQTADVEDLLRIEQRAFSGDLLTRRALRYLISRAHGIGLVCTVGDQPVGYAIVLLRRGSRSGRIYSLAVDPDWRGRQIGRLLLEAIETRLAAKGISRVQLEVRADNEPALRRYHGLGYEVYASEPGYYEDGEGALKMRKELAEVP